MLGLRGPFGRVALYAETGQSGVLPPRRQRLVRVWPEWPESIVRGGIRRHVIECHRRVTSGEIAQCAVNENRSPLPMSAAISPCWPIMI